MPQIAATILRDGVEMTVTVNTALVAGSGTSMDLLVRIPATGETCLCLCRSLCSVYPTTCVLYTLHDVLHVYSPCTRCEAIVFENDVLCSLRMVFIVGVRAVLTVWQCFHCLDLERTVSAPDAHRGQATGLPAALAGV